MVQVENQTILKTRSGQAAIEMLAAMGFAVPLVGLTMAACYFFWSSWILDHAHYEYLVCKQTLYAYHCKKDFDGLIAQALPWGKLESLYERKNSEYLEKSYRFEFKFLALHTFSMQNKIVVPRPQ